ncbi:hypothetical protein GCM10009754_12860 [Amycolatopsis minnesotensis]|uniref:DUF3558 domain-containing protein n=2 Tax=Amycolatopsis minnesotensis TaxID=337894 RepID=A0ABN2Q7N2_9PSEU
MVQAANLVSAVRTKAASGGTGEARCTYNDQESNGVSVGVVKRANWLQSTYAAGQSGKLAYFTPLPDVAGYPGAVSNNVDQRANGVCSVGVALSDHEFLSVISTFGGSSPFRSDPCPVLQKVAEASVKNMRGGA